jgi:hypothetical protein
MTIKPRHDLQEEYTYSTVNDKGEKIKTYNKIPPMLIRNIELLLKWYFEHTFPDTCLWFTLNECKFKTGNSITSMLLVTKTPAPTTLGTTSPTSMVPTPIPVSKASSFLRSIKRSPSDYNKFKDDSRWKQWYRHLKATSNSHGITHILDPAYIPLTDSAKELFNVQQIFIYSVLDSA